MADKKPARNVVDYSSAFPLPFFDVEKRIIELEEMLEEEDLELAAQANIQAAIKMYETKELPPKIGKLVYVQDGKICEKWPDFHRHYLAEGVLLQLTQRTEPEQAEPSARQAHQLQHSVAYNTNLIMMGHEIFVQMRLVERFGGDGTIFHCSIMNDTGSSVVTLFPPDLVAMNHNYMTYAGHKGPLSIQTSNGSVQRNSLLVQIQLLYPDNTPCSDWIDELAVIQPMPQNNPVRLSGDVMRQELFFATSPGNRHLYVAQRKAGIVKQLPLV